MYTIHMFVVVFILCNLVVLGTVYFSHNDTEWQPRTRSEIKLSAAERGVLEKEEGSKMIDLSDYLPLKGMDNFIWDDEEACIRLEGLVRDAQHWSSKRSLNTPLFLEETIATHIEPGTCTVANPDTQIWFEDLVLFLIAAGHPQAELLFARLNYGIPK